MTHDPALAPNAADVEAAEAVDAVESVVNVIPVVIPAVGAAMIFLLAFIAVYVGGPGPLARPKPRTAGLFLCRRRNHATHNLMLLLHGFDPCPTDKKRVAS